jgi:predicted TIM-barrel fold metal-dependent hydrolase
MAEPTTVNEVNEHLTVQRLAIKSRFTSRPDDRPERQPRHHLLISVDDHLVEPPHLFKGRRPNKFADREPRVIDTADGNHAWLLDGLVLPEIAVNAVAGRPVEEEYLEPMRFDFVRRGTWDIEARIADMDVDGVFASLNFPSALGFGGVRLTLLPDPEFVLALVQAYNDWHFEEWAGYRPERVIPCQIPYLLDAELAAKEIRANANRGYHTVTFPDLAHLVGLPSLFTKHWDPFWAACEETATVVSVHACSGGVANKKDPKAPVSAVAPFFGAAQAIHPAIEWIYAGIPNRFPNLRVCLSEGGIGWVIGLKDRLDHEYARNCPLVARHLSKRVTDAEFRFLHARRSHDIAPPSSRDWHPPDPARDGLSTRRFELAQLTGQVGQALRRNPAGRGSPHVVAERV